MPTTALSLQKRTKNASEVTTTVMLVALYSQAYPAAGESYGVSAVAGALLSAFPEGQINLQIIDMVSIGSEDCTRIAKEVREVQPDILGIAVQYGTYSVLSRWYEYLKRELSPKALTVFGGPLASSLPEKIIAEIDRSSCVIVGEGDEAFPALVQKWRDHEDLADVPNLIYERDGRLERTPRALVPASLIAIPYREHTADIAARGGQIFVESSRGCSWAACTFCLRGLTDLHGVGTEYRRVQPAEVAAELSRLHLRGIEAVTIADEDFFGGNLQDVADLVGQLEVTSTKSSLPALDASMTVASVSNKRDTADESRERFNLLKRLKRLGLRKVFLGIESGSESQLKRYAKGHNQPAIRLAIQRIRELEIDLEIGVILFDPLCSVEEVRESVSFLQAEGVVSAASGISSSLRLQENSSYLRILQKYEKRHSVTLYSPDSFDPDTLSYSYSFANKEVEKLFRVIGAWNRRSEPLYYPLKSLTRFGNVGALGAATETIRGAVRTFRESYARAVIAASIEAAEDTEDTSSAEMSKALVDLATTFLNAYPQVPKHLAGHGALLSAEREAVKILTERQEQE